MNAPRPRKRRAQGGYALLEALIAVVVAAVGFIGAARMQTFGLTINNSAQARQKATLLGYQMTDRIRANQAGVDRACLRPADAPASTACLAAASGCTPALLAARRRRRVAAPRSRRSCPSGTGVVCLDSTPDDGDAAAPPCDGIGNVIAVKLWWTDKVGTPRFVVSGAAMSRASPVRRPRAPRRAA